MNVPLLDLKAQYATIRDQIRSAVDAILESQRFVLGSEVALLEAEIAGLCGVPHAVAVASGTDALLLSLKALGAGAGTSVVTVPFTFFATAGAIINTGARPIFVDIQESSFNMDPAYLNNLFERECSFNLSSGMPLHKPSQTIIKAIIPVHLYGQCAEMAEIREIAQRYQVPVIEDACQAIGAEYGSEKAGSMGKFGCFSFFPSKNLGGAGDGGMVITRDKDLYDRLMLLRTHGGSRKYYHSIVGFNSRLDEIQAAILRVKLKYLGAWNRARQEHAAFYQREFAQHGLGTYLRAPAALPGRTHIFHQFVIRCSERNALREHLTKAGVGTEVYYPVPLHEQECFRNLGYAPTDFPKAREAAADCLALPIYPELTKEQQTYVVQSIADFYCSR